MRPTRSHMTAAAGILPTGQLDSVMNYPWQKAILRYVRGEDDGTGLGTSIRTIAENYPPDVLQAVMNILSTHDTPRAINAILDPRDGDRAELAGGTLRRSSLQRGKNVSKWRHFYSLCSPVCRVFITATRRA